MKRPTVPTGMKTMENHLCIWPRTYQRTRGWGVEGGGGGIELELVGQIIREISWNFDFGENKIFVI